MSERPDPAHYPIDLGEEPALSDVLQDDHDGGVLVRQAGPLQVREVPPRSGGMLSTNLTTADISPPESIAGGDPRRKRLHLRTDTVAVFVGTSKTAVAAGSAYYMPAGTDLDVFHRDQVFAASAGASGVIARLSYLVEQWAD